ncbi:MAG TPA: hypothetical protein DEH78_22960 [Solibacterales bacterium]|nr:hypothetical protein [Bryobacterales bacterium]
MSSCRFLPFAALALCAVGHAEAPPTPQPVYVYLESRIDDHLNPEIGDQKLRRTVSLLERLRQSNPRFRPSCVYSVTGAVSQLFSTYNAGNKIVDSMKAAVTGEVIEVGYDGAAEPTDRQRPRPNFRTGNSPEDRWRARSQALDWFLTEFKNFITGEPDPTVAGGLKRTQEVFGEVVWISGVSEELGGDPELVHLLNRYNRSAILPGLPESHTYPARNVHGYAGSISGISDLMSPEPGYAPEVFWQDGHLRISETSGPAVKPFVALDGPEKLKELLSKLDRSRPHVIRVRLGPDRLHLKADFLAANPSPVRYCYETPKFARIPVEALRPQEEVDAGFRQEETLLRWLAEDYFPANPGSGFVSAAALRRMAAASHPEQVSIASLRAAAANLVKRWKGTVPSAYAQAGPDSYSLADMFLLLANALATAHRTGQVPASVPLTPVYGPLQMTDELGPNAGEVTAGAIAAKASELTGQLNDRTWKPVPSNAVPEWVTVDGIKLTCAQFLRLMAEAIMAPSPAATLPVRMSGVYSEASSIYPYSARRHSEMGATWTLKPARLRDPIAR